MTLFKYSNDALPWIKESIFRDIFLPGFIARDREVNLRWIKEIAINPYARVRVVDDNDSSNVLFEVPAFLTGVEETNLDISAASNHFGKILDAGYGAKAANKFLTKVMGETIVNHKENKDDIDTWQEILTRYGYSDLKTEEGTHNDTSGMVEEEEEFG